MAHYSAMLLASIVVLALLSIASATYSPIFRVQGTIFCVDDGKWIPKQGAGAIVICPLFSMKSTITDKNGYYLVELPSKRFSNDCKVFLDTLVNGKGNCIVPSNINNGLTGASLVKSKTPNVYSVGPFVYHPTPLSH